jgi:hypothetical protein
VRPRVTTDAWQVPAVYVVVHASARGGVGPHGVFQLAGQPQEGAVLERASRGALLIVPSERFKPAFPRDGSGVVRR